MTVSTNLIPALLSAAAGLAMALKGTVQGPGLILGLAALALPALRVILRHRLHVQAVAKAEAADLPALFRAFSPNEAEPDSPDNAGP